MLTNKNQSRRVYPRGELDCVTPGLQSLYSHSSATREPWVLLWHSKSLVTLSCCSSFDLAPPASLCIPGSPRNVPSSVTVDWCLCSMPRLFSLSGMPCSATTFHLSSFLPGLSCFKEAFLDPPGRDERHFFCVLAIFRVYRSLLCIQVLLCVPHLEQYPEHSRCSNHLLNQWADFTFMSSELFVRLPS